MEFGVDGILAEMASANGYRVEKIFRLREKRVGASITQSAVPRGKQNGAVLYESAMVIQRRLSSRLRRGGGFIEAGIPLQSSVWIPLGKSLLIRMFNPVWNKLIDGFGNHDPGKGRYNQQRSPWDVLHSGRSWAEKLQPNPKSADLLCQMILQCLDLQGGFSFLKRGGRNEVLEKSVSDFVPPSPT